MSLLALLVQGTDEFYDSKAPESYGGLLWIAIIVAGIAIWGAIENEKKKREKAEQEARLAREEAQRKAAKRAKKAEKKRKQEEERDRIARDVGRNRDDQ